MSRINRRTSLISLSKEGIIIKKKKKEIDLVLLRDADKTTVLSNGDMIVRIVYDGEGDYIYSLYQHSDEWEEVDKLISIYQRQFQENCTKQEKLKANEAGITLLNKFMPLFKKYTTLITTGQINFRNLEQRQFVRLFMPEPNIQKILNKKNISLEMRDIISMKFNFIIEGYGQQSEEEIMNDLKMLFLILAKRYKNVGRSFCCYVYNLYRYEVFRHIQKYQRDIANFHYKITTLDKCEESFFDDYSYFEEDVCEDNQGLPNQDWIDGAVCSDIFKNLSSQDRFILSKYYLQNWNDKQIAQYLGKHINTINNIRKRILKTLCNNMNMDITDIIRHRNSGIKAVVDT